MKQFKTKFIIISLFIQGIFLTGLLLLHFNFTLPVAQIEGVDVLTYPGETIQLSCIIQIHPPSWSNLLKKNLCITFSDKNHSKLKGTSNTEGIAICDYNVKDSLTEEIFMLSLNYDTEFSYHRAGSSLIVAPVSKGAEIVLCDLGSTLTKSSWDELNKYSPDSWKIDKNAVLALHSFSSGSLQKVIYFCPGNKLLTTEAREYVRGTYRQNQILPKGVILFPEAPPQSQDFETFFFTLKKKWPRVKAGISNQQKIINALVKAKIPVFTFNKGAQSSVSPDTEISYVSSWLELNTVLK